MRRCERGAEPEVLLSRAARWTAAFLADTSREFHWPQVEGRSLNLHLLPALSAMTAEHCAYCDGYPITAVAYKTIDHFRPKAQFRDLAFRWDNFFLACPACNSHKREQWDERLLRPDEVEFAFLRYFIFDFASGELEPNPAAAPDDQARARTTIDLLGLNSEGSAGARKRALRVQPTAPISSEDRDDRPYRFLWELDDSHSAR